VRLIAAIAAIVAVVGLKAPSAIVAIGVLPLLALLGDATGRRTLGRRMLLVAPLAIVAVAARWLAHAPIPDIARPALRIVVAIMWSTWLTRALRPREIESALRALGLPAPLVALLGQTRRFGAQLLDTLGEAWTAATLRGGLSSGRATIRTAGCVAGVVLVRAFDRSERVAIAAQLRGAGFERHATAPHGAPALTDEKAEERA
jgi:energy-coupling factor transporter transmembrane protein EcfT